MQLSPAAEARPRPHPQHRLREEPIVHPGSRRAWDGAAGLLARADAAQGEAHVWMKLSDDFPSHPKIVAIGPIGMVLHVRVLAYCARHLTDGAFRLEVVEHECHDLAQFEKREPGGALPTAEETAVRWVQRMLIGRLWERPGGRGILKIHDFKDYNPTRISVLTRRVASSERVAKYRDARRNARCNAEVTPPQYPYPYPYYKNYPPIPPLPASEPVTALQPIPGPTKTKPTRSTCETCVRVVEYMNAVGRTSFPVRGVYLADLHARHGEHGEEACRRVIRNRAAEWIFSKATGPDEKDMRPYYRPQTIFRLTKFPGYLGQTDPGDPVHLAPNLDRRGACCTHPFRVHGSASCALCVRIGSSCAGWREQEEKP